MKTFLLKINDFFFKDAGSENWLSSKETEELLKKFPLPKNNIYRALFQYKAQKKIKGQLKFFILDFFSFFIIFPLLLLLLLKNLANTVPEKKTNIRPIAYSITDLKLQIIPDSLLEYYHITRKEIRNTISFADILYILKIVKHSKLNFFFLFKSILSISFYSAIINNTKCSAIINNIEYSFTSSLLTDYCNKKNVTHINVMHGEKLFYIRDSFFCFHKCYVWDEHYKKLFIKLKADPSQFIIEKPLLLKKIAQLSDAKSNKFTYFLQGNETREEIIFLNKYIYNKTDATVVFRLHPAYSPKALIKQLPEINFEDPQKKDFFKSLSESRYVCSKFSTVLYQALIAKKKVIIDDISRSGVYDKLLDLEYIIVKKQHIRLSELNNTRNEAQK